MMWGKGKAGAAATPETKTPETTTAATTAAKSITATAQQAQFAQLFSQAVAVLMRDQNYKNLPLRELEFLLPPIMGGQCAIANAKATADGPFVPVAMALWAKVSPAVDQQLGENLDKPVRLKPGDWTSGNIPWLITLAGSPPALASFVKQLCQKEFKGQSVKMRSTDKSGARTVQVLTPS